MYIARILILFKMILQCKTQLLEYETPGIDHDFGMGNFMGEMDPTIFGENNHQNQLKIYKVIEANENGEFLTGMNWDILDDFDPLYWSIKY